MDFRQLRGDLPYVWREGLKEIWYNGEIVPDDRGFITMQSMGLSFIVSPTTTPPEGSTFTPDVNENYLIQGYNPLKGDHDYTYGERTRGWKATDEALPVDQFRVCLERLRKNIFTRRAVMSTINPSVDCLKDEFPCMMTFQFLFQDKALNALVSMRSNDFFRAFPQNVTLYSKWLIDMAEALGVQVGYVYVLDGSAHIYEESFEEVARFLKKDEIPSHRRAEITRVKAWRDQKREREASLEALGVKHG